jgi:hypothetical protein
MVPRDTALGEMAGDAGGRAWRPLADTVDQPIPTAASKARRRRSYTDHDRGSLLSRNGTRLT